MKQVELSAALELEHEILLAPDLISRIESQERAVRDKEIRAICHVLKTDPNALFSWKE